MHFAETHREKFKAFSGKTSAREQGQGSADTIQVNDVAVSSVVLP
jgi:hypothetical protein